MSRSPSRTRENSASPAVRNRVLAAARNLFLEPGYSITTLKDVGEAAGTSESGVMRVAPSKYGLLMEVYNEAWGAVNKAIDEKLVLATFADPRDKIVAICRTVWEMYDQDRGTMAFVIMNIGNTDTLVVTRKATASISVENRRYVMKIETLCKMVVSQCLVPGVTARALSECILGTIEGVLLGWYLFDNTNHEYPSKIGIEEALVPLTLMLFGWKEAASSRNNRQRRDRVR